MAYEKVGGNRGPIFKWDAVGKYVEGFFMGVKQGKQFSNANAPSRLILLQPLAGGEQITVAATPGLADDIAGLPHGVLVRIEYKGLQKSQTSGREFKAFDIQADRSRTVNGQPAGSAPAAAAAQAPASAPVQGVAGLEEKLRGNKGAQVATIMLDALKSKYPDAASYEKNLRELLAALGIAA